MLRQTILLTILIVTALGHSPSRAEDWSRFRGPDGAGVSASNIPETWSDDENLKWACRLPGRGVSSPIVVADRVFVTAYSGFAMDSENPGDPSDLVRHLICLDRKTGQTLWQHSPPSRLPEDKYEGFITDHGYASSTPASDGQRVFAFFGKSGVFAFDLGGRRLWQVDVGNESGPSRWGSAASPIVYQDLVIVNACDESQSLVAIEAATGTVAWRAEASLYEGSFSTPIIAKTDDGRDEIIVPLADEVWGFDPKSGKLNWHVSVALGKYVTSSPVAADGVVYVAASSKVTAIRLGGQGDVTDSHVLWTRNAGPGLPSPIIHEGNLHWVATNGVFTCADAATGKTLWRKRLGGGRNTTYASLTKAGDRWLVTTQTGGSYMVAVKPEFKVISNNKFTDDGTPFKASAAVSDDELFLRSERFVYCVAADGEADFAAILKKSPAKTSQESYGELIDPGKMFRQNRSPNSVGPAQLLQTFDVNNDNKISREELAESPMPAFAQTMMMFRGDKNKDGFIDDEERIALQGDVKLDPNEVAGRVGAANRPPRP